jgi:vacuolar-type H+-ATPase subunit C/Vma6
MFRAFVYAFILAKVYGMMGKTYIGTAFQDLLRLKKLEEIFDTLFPGERAEAREESLSTELEARFVRAAITSMRRVLSLLGNPPDLLVHILRKYEYQSLKSLIRNLLQGGTEKPIIWDLGKYARLRLTGRKDFREALAASPYAWVAPHMESSPLFEIENMLDRDYYSRLLRLGRGLPLGDRSGVMRLVILEASLTNATWALRLRFFFGLDGQAAAGFFIPGMVHTHSTAISEAFEIPADSVEGWRQWRYGWLLEDQLGEAFRSPDPVRAEQKAAGRLALRAHQLLHEDPFTLTPVVAYFKLKELETRMLTTAVEALRLSVPAQEVLSMVGAG